jgi:hypothetical protein
LNIKYGHILDLAPTEEIRNLQKEVDAEKGELKSERKELGRTFIAEYENRVLKKFDFESFFEKLEEIGAKKVVLFCVEEIPAACHRSLVSKELEEKYGYDITHL